MIYFPPGFSKHSQNPWEGGGSRPTAPLDTEYQESFRAVSDAISAKRPEGAPHSYPQYQRLGTARRISKHLKLDHRVEMCGLHPVPGREAEVVRRPNGRHGFANLMHCGSVWVCPACRTRIANERGREIDAAITAAHVEGLHVSMVTLTQQHSVADSLDELIDAQTVALRRTFSGRAWSALADRMGYVGRIRAVEVKHGDVAGWHPHVHLLVFHEGEIDGDALFDRWSHALSLHGRVANRAAFDVRRVATDPVSVARTAAYIAKMEALSYREKGRWSMGDEMTADHAKHSGGETPEQLLDRAANGDADAIEAYGEYIEATKGLPSLRWSNGLRERLGLRDARSDEDVANDNEGEGETVRTISVSELFALVEANLRAKLLREADAHGRRGIERVIREALEQVYGRRRPIVA